MKYLSDVEIGFHVKKLRLRAGINQEQLGDELGINQAGISRIEGGSQPLSIKQLIKLSSLFNLSIDSILKGDEAKNLSIDVVSKTSAETQDFSSLYWKLKREKKNLSQSDVAKKLGYKSKQIISNWETGKCLPPKKAIPVLLEIYEINIEEYIEQVLNQQRKDLKNEFLNKSSKKAI